MTRDYGEPFDALLRTVAASQNVAVPGITVLGDRFLLQRRLGEGGFGVVFEARDLRNGESVALKVLRRAEADWLYRFKREFRALQGLAHQNLVTLDELFGENNQWFFTMELVEGVNFIDYVREKRTNVSIDESLNSGVRDAYRATPIAPGEPASANERTLANEQASASSFHEHKLRESLRQLFAGLGALHAAGKVHRDIKPSNVLITRAGRVVLIDFGLIADTLSTTESGAIGTPAYMAPEQALARDVGPAADIYSVGVMLYESLTGRLPIEGPALKVLMDKQTRQPAAPATIAPDISDDLNALCQRLLQLDPTLRPTAEEASRSLAESRPSESAASQAPPGIPTFVGRSAELAELRAAFDVSTQGRLETVLISGASGIGKTHLVRHFIRNLLSEHPGTWVLEGRCHEREAIPYKTLDGIVDALTRRMSRMPSSDVAVLLPTRRAMLSRIFPAMLRIPELARQRAKTPRHSEHHNELRQYAFLELRELFTRVAMHHQTILFIDDLQWGDDDGLRALAEVLRSPDAPALLFVGTMRMKGGEGNVDFERLRAALPSEVRTIELRNLESEEAYELAVTLLKHAGAPGADPKRVAGEAGGHPLFVEELARQAAQGSGLGEPNLESAIWSRVLSLEPPVREIAELVAVAGKPLPRQVAAVAARLGQQEFQRSLSILRASNLVRTNGGSSADTMDLYHDRLREAVLARLDPSRRQELHETLANAFEASSHRDPETLAIHWRDAGNPVRAGGYAAAAGDQAARTLAFDRAAAWFEQSLALLPKSDANRHELRVKLGDALAFAGRGALAAEHLQAAAMESQAVEALELRRRAAEQLLRSGHFDQGIEASRAVLAAMGMRIPATRFQTLANLLYYGLLLRIRGLGFHERDESQVTAEERMRVDTCFSMAAALGFIDPMIGFVFHRRALLLALEVGDLERIARSITMDAAYNGMAGGPAWRRAERLLQHGHQLADRSGTIQARVMAIGMTGIVLYCNGRFREAAESFARVSHVLQDGSTGFVFERTTAHILIIRSLGYLGRFKELRRWQQDGLREAIASGNIYAAVNLRTGFPNLAWLVEDRPDLADAEIDLAARQTSTRGFHLEHFYGLLARVQVRLYVGDVNGGHALAAELLKRTNRSLLWRIQYIRLLARYLRGASALAQVTGDWKRLLREATQDARCIEREGMAWTRPFAKILRAGIALHRGAREDAQRGLDAAVHEFEEHDMTGYAIATRDRAARLRRGASSTSEIARARDLLQADGVVDPERMIGMLVPGFKA